MYIILRINFYLKLLKWYILYKILLFLKNISLENTFYALLKIFNVIILLHYYINTNLLKLN